MRSRDLSPQSEVAAVFREVRKPRRESLDRLLPAVYAELRAIAHRNLAAHGHAGSLATTGLVHEAYIRLLDARSLDLPNRAHFLALASEVMRNLLVDRARARRYQKRGGGATRFPLDEAVDVAEMRARDLVALDDALTALAAFDERKSRVVEMRFFVGLSVEETAEVLRVSPETVKRDWRIARFWLRRELDGRQGNEP